MSEFDVFPFEKYDGTCVDISHLSRYQQSRTAQGAFRGCAYRDILRYINLNEHGGARVGGCEILQHHPPICSIVFFLDVLSFTTNRMVATPYNVIQIIINQP